jgi:pimeloyl-ACP methyl ester carboxylesterase
LTPLLGLVGAAIAFFGAAFVTNSVVGLSAAGLVTCFGISTGLTLLAAREVVPHRRISIGLGVGAGTALLCAILAALTIFRPIASLAEPAQLPPQASYWDLPTGSHIAYLHVPAYVAANATPIIRLHGGPGAFAVANKFAVDYYGQLARDGYDVYVYDQIGSGLSARLHDLKEYTVTRQVEDLEAIRQEIGADQVILIGESWGGTLAANYMAAYPGHVAKAVFSSPAPINPAEWGEYQEDIKKRLPAEKQKQVENLSGQPRLMALMLLASINPQAALDLAPDREMDNWMDSILAIELPALICNPADFPQGPPPRGFGFWVGRMEGNEFYAKRSTMDPRAKLAVSQTPVLILRGECDHIKWPVTYQYRSTFARSTLLYFPGGGHIIYYDKPDLYMAAVRAFLLDQPSPLPPYESSIPPN